MESNVLAYLALCSNFLESPLVRYFRKCQTIPKKKKNSNKIPLAGVYLFHLVIMQL